jgi:hypothetical protein
VGASFQLARGSRIGFLDTQGSMSTSNPGLWDSTPSA